MGAGSSKEFPYILKGALSRHGDFEVCDAVKASDQSPVTVLVVDITKAKDLNQCRSYLKRCKTLKHPALLHVLDALETERNIYIVTDHMQPLEMVMATTSTSSGLTDDLIVDGIYQLLRAIDFLCNTVKLVHGAVTTSSIFVDDGGDFRLGGFGAITEWQNLISASGGTTYKQIATISTAVLPPSVDSNAQSYSIDIYSMAWVIARVCIIV